jgi:predicted house-cleaning noncanonical NTP pyrophosphatase (MazG superfamily)
MGKLVRDKIPEIIGEKARFHVADADEYRTALVSKLVEEALEFQKEPSRAELADVLEVLDAMFNAFGWTFDQIAEAKNTKVRDKGGFEKRYILDGTG